MNEREFLSKVASDCVNARHYATCRCGHAMYLHDEGVEACIDCDCGRVVVPESEIEAACDEIGNATIVCVDCHAVLHDGEKGVAPRVGLCLECAAKEQA